MQTMCIYLFDADIPHLLFLAVTTDSETRTKYRQFKLALYSFVENTYYHLGKLWTYSTISRGLNVNNDC